jgi:hypothetical protein
MSLRISALAARNQAEIMYAARRGVHRSRTDAVRGFSVAAVNLDSADQFSCRLGESQLESSVFEHCVFRTHLDPETSSVHRLEVLGQFDGGPWLKVGVSLSAASGKPYSLQTGRDDFHTGQTNTNRPESDATRSRGLTTSASTFNLGNRVNYVGYVPPAIALAKSGQKWPRGTLRRSSRGVEHCRGAGLVPVREEL